MNWPEVDQLSELRFTDYKGRDVLILVTITNVEIEECRFGGNFTELPGNAFDVLQDLVIMRDLRAAAAAEYPHVSGSLAVRNRVPISATTRRPASR